MWQRRHDSAGGVFEGGTLGGAPTKQPAQKSVHPIGDRKAQALPCRRPHAMLAVVNHVLAGFRVERLRSLPCCGGVLIQLPPLSPPTPAAHRARAASAADAQLSPIAESARAECRDARNARPARSRP